ncbi:hypothetical protein AC249_AIPGENE17212 [Exaiptasia diaphana]|nr:hypothetical protein AC249_AIPGENE17212 [Exaiptasia diaphana]
MIYRGRGWETKFHPSHQSCFSLVPGDIETTKKGNGRLTVGFVERHPGKDLPVLASLNIWISTTDKEFLEMKTYGCSYLTSEIQSLISWRRFSKLRNNLARLEKPATCKFIRDQQMFLKNESESTLVSPVNFKKLKQLSSHYFYFTYAFLGKNNKVLKVGVNFSQEAIVPVWLFKDDIVNQWRTGKIPINSNHPYQVMIVSTYRYCYISKRSQRYTYVESLFIMRMRNSCTIT